MIEQGFWKKSWDEGITDHDPAEWETNYADLVAPTFEEFPDRVALSYMGTEITFTGLDLYANKFANMLQSCGLEKGDVVGINLPNIPEYVIAWLGTIRAGCVVSGVSPLMSADEMEYQLKDSQAKGLVTLDAIFAARLKGIADRLPDLKMVTAASVGMFLPFIKRTLGRMLGKIPKGDVTPLPGKQVFTMAQVINSDRFKTTPVNVKISPDDIAYIQYTGGTTGSPKGARLTHRNVVAHSIITMDWFGWKRGEGIALSGFPFFHIAGLTFNKNCVYLGWPQVLVPNPRDTDYMCSMIEKYKPTIMVNVPSLYHLLMANPRFRTLDHSNLHACVSAAAPFPEESQKELEAIVGQGKLLEAYGMTETAPLTVVNPSKGIRKLGTVGLPLPNTDVKLMDPVTGQEVGIGEPGEICVRGPQVMLGYHNKPEETAAAVDEDGFMHTGDVGVMDDDGYIRLVDRTKDMIIVSGFKVFSKRVEEVLAEHPSVEQLALIGVPNPDRPGSEMVKAFVQLHAGLEGQDEAAFKESFLDLAKEKLAPYEVPKLVEIRKELPLTAVGKIDKKALRK